MNKLNKEELLMIDGGLSISGTLLNSFNSLLKTILDIGRSVGTAIIRVTKGKMCQL